MRGSWRREGRRRLLRSNSIKGVSAPERSVVVERAGISSLEAMPCPALFVAAGRRHLSHFDLAPVNLVPVGRDSVLYSFLCRYSFFIFCPQICLVQRHGRAACYSLFFPPDNFGSYAKDWYFAACYFLRTLCI
jgi:hypothetical protein